MNTDNNNNTSEYIKNSPIVYNDYIQVIENYCYKHDITDMHNIPYSQWNSILNDMYTMIIYPNEKVLLFRDSNINYYDTDKILVMYNLFKKLSYDYNQEISYSKFKIFINISGQNMTIWRDSLTNKRIDIIKMLQEDNETSIFDLGNTKGGYNPVLAMAKLNHYHKWNDNGIRTENMQNQAIETTKATELLENKLSQIVGQLDIITDQ